MEKNNLVSIIIPCYNQAQYLEEAVQSAVNQTYLNIEIIIVNDGSPDNTQEVADRLQKKYPKKIHIVTQENSGLYAARNNGIRKASGTYIMPLDSDDILDRTIVTKCKETMEKYNADIVYPGYRKFGIRSDINPLKAFLESDPLYITPCSPIALFKKQVWEKVGGYKKNMIDGYEDWEFWVNAYKHGYKFQHHPEVLFSYRTKEESMYTIAYEKDTYLKAKIIMNHPELYTKYRVQQAITTIKETEKFADIYFYFTQNMKLNSNEIGSILSHYLANNPLDEVQIIPTLNKNIGLCSLELFEGVQSLDNLSRELGTDLILFYSPLYYQVSELQNSEFAWSNDKGIVVAQGTIFPFVRRSVKDDLQIQLVAYQRLEHYYEYIHTKLNNLQHKYNIDTVNAQKKLDSLQHKYNIDTSISKKKLDQVYELISNVFSIKIYRNPIKKLKAYRRLYMLYKSSFK